VAINVKGETKAMKKSFIIAVIISAVLLSSCGSKTNKSDDAKEIANKQEIQSETTIVASNDTEEVPLAESSEAAETKEENKTPDVSEQPDNESENAEPPADEKQDEEPETIKESEEENEINADPIEIDGQGVYNTNVNYLVDLDGDGTKEKLLVKFSEVEHIGDYPDAMIYINDNLEYQIQYVDNPDTNFFALTDINTNDSQKEIAIYQNGPSNDPATTFICWNDNEIKELFIVDDDLWGMFNSAKSTPKILEGFVLGDGTVNWNGRLEILQTWYAPMHLRLNSNNSVTYLDELYYPPIYHRQEGDNLGPTMPLIPIYVCEERDSSSKRTLIEPQTPIDFDITDNISWVHIISDSGSGWIDLNNIEDYIDSEYEYLFEDSKGREYRSFSIGMDLFDNLCMTD